MSKIEYPSLATWYVVKPRYISTGPKQKLRNNIDVIDYFAGDNEMSRPKSASVKDIDIDIADILNQKYRYRIDIGHGDIDPPLIWENEAMSQDCYCEICKYFGIEKVKESIRHRQEKFVEIFRAR